MSSVRVLLVAGGLLLASGVAGAGDESPPASVIPPVEAPMRFLHAFRKGDRDAMRAIVRAPQLDAFLLAEDLLFHHVEAALSDAPAPSDYLAAAVALAECARDLPAGEGLARQVRAWADLDPAGLARTRRLGRAVRVAMDAFGRGELEEVLRAVRGASADVGTADRSILTVYLHLLEGRACMRTARWEEGEVTFRAGAAEAHGLGWHRAEGICLDHAGQCAANRLDYRGARELHEGAVAAYADLDETSDAADAEANLAWILARTGDPRRALELATRLRARYASEGKRRRVASMLELLSEVASRLGEHERAAELTEQGVAELKAIGSDGKAAVALAGLGSALSNAGCHAEALRALDRAQDLLGTSVDLLARANVLWHAGTVHCQIGLLTDAQRLLGDALELFRRGADPLGAALARAQLARVRLAQGELEAAAVLWREQLEFWRQKGLVSEAADTALSLASVWRRQGRLDDAADAAARALEVFAPSGQVEAAANAECVLAAVALDRGELEKAQRIAGHALARLTATGVTSRLEAGLRCVLARSHLRRGEPVRALEVLQRASEIETTYVQGLGDHAGLGLRTRSRPTSDLGVQAAFALVREDPKQAEEALAEAYAYSESGRGWLLAEQLANADALLTRRLSPGLLRSDTLTRSDVAAARGSLVRLLAAEGTASERLEEARRKLERVWARRRQVVSRIQREARQVADLVYPKPAPLEAVRRQLDADTALVMFHFTREQAFALVVTHTGGHIHELGSSTEITDECRRYLALVAAAGSPEAEVAGRLYARLVAPLEGDLVGRSRLVLCPDDVLAFLPWAALRLPGEDRPVRLVERWETVLVPSATIFVRLARAAREEAPGQALLALGDPVYPVGPGAAGGRLFERLPASGDEVRAIARLFPPDRRTVLLRARASLSALEAALEDAGPWRALHLACHAYVDDEHPRRSTLVLAGGEMLDLDTIYRLRAPADLVVVSSCASARSQVVRGEGALGFVRGFFFSGARRVLASNWKVSDDSTCEFMTRFYEGLEREGLAHATALRRAQLDRLKAGGDAAHPHHWAAFTLWGPPE